ncbi:hypothetical protein C5167_043430 [Papaver somniferum]|uniref:Uncharacterized protein n=1 Tax=Papaver somniferum TaxID=3469 RepID=A0A4Y7L9I5_PAPSO|nr:nucleolar protein 58-like [Papaver somniferum]RZC80825.1 hypothetical protein C5167_043430 [Papaver somniferum]
MKKTKTMRNEVSDDESSSDSDSSSDSETEINVKLGKRKAGPVIDFEALSRHGYRGGPSVLKVPEPKVDDKDRDWSWSSGKLSSGSGETEESFEERQRTRAALNDGEELLYAKTRKDREIEREKERVKEMERKEIEREKKSFSQKEKRKRDLGQASRGKNYVEEEKRLLRESGVYSGLMLNLL